MSPDVVEEVVPREIVGEMKLWSAVFADGIKEYKKGSIPAISWFWSEDIYPGSFEWLCELFKFDSTYARNKAKNDQTIL